MSAYPMVPGHEIVGIVKQVGEKVSKFKVGDTVGIGCLVDSCRECDNCKQDLEQYCLGGATYTYSVPERHGDGITYGGYSDRIVCDEKFVLKVGKNLPLEKVAPLLCAGITINDQHVDVIRTVRPNRLFVNELKPWKRMRRPCRRIFRGDKQ